MKFTIPKLNSHFLLLQILLGWMVLRKSSPLEKGFPMCCKSFLMRAANTVVVEIWVPACCIRNAAWEH